MQNEEAIHDLMAAIRDYKPVKKMCSLCVKLYADALPPEKRLCWFKEAANPDLFGISLSDIISSAGRKNAENCEVPDIVQMVLEIQSLAAGSDSGEE